MCFMLKMAHPRQRMALHEELAKKAKEERFYNLSNLQRVCGPVLQKFRQHRDASCVHGLW